MPGNKDEDCGRQQVPERRTRNRRRAGKERATVPSPTEQMSEVANMSLAGDFMIVCSVFMIDLPWAVV